jgi:proteasome lid subunit RPN8/RPN11
VSDAVWSSAEWSPPAAADLPATVSMPAAVLDAIVAHGLRGLPLEACGLLVGDPATGVVDRFVPCTNLAASSRVYTLDPREHLRAERAAEAEGKAVIGVVHSHTHTPPYPSPTDIAQAPDPTWAYVIVSLEHPEASTRAWRIIDGSVSEVSVVVPGR